MTAQSCFVPMPGRVLQLFGGRGVGLAESGGRALLQCDSRRVQPGDAFIAGPVWPPMGGVMCLPFGCVCLSRGGRWLAGGRMARSMGIGPAG